MNYHSVKILKESFYDKKIIKYTELKIKRCCIIVGCYKIIMT